MFYTVGEMAKLLGVPASTLRYYDKEGLLPFVERSSRGRNDSRTPGTIFAPSLFEPPTDD